MERKQHNYCLICDSPVFTIVGVDAVKVDGNEYLCEEHKDVPSVEACLLNGILKRFDRTNELLICLHRTLKTLTEVIVTTHNEPNTTCKLISITHACADCSR